MLLLKHGWSALYPIQHSNHAYMNSFEPARGDVGVSGGGVTIDMLNQVLKKR